MHRVSSGVLSILLLLVVAACATTSPASVPAGNTTPTPSATATATGTPVSQASPDEGTSARTLAFSGAPATSVEVPDPAKPALYATTDDTLYQADPSGAWSQAGRWDPAYSLLVDPTNPLVLYSGGHPGCAVGGPAIPLRKSSDGGQTWETLLTGQNVRPMIVDPRNPQVIYGERCSLAMSVNGGQTWTDYPMTPSFDVSAMALVGTKLYVLITSEGGTSRIREVDVSDPAHPNIGSDLREFWGGGTVIASPEHIIVGEPHGVDISADGGKTWTSSRTGLESVTVSVNALTQPIPKDELSRKFGIYSLAVDPEDSSRLFAGTIRGLYVSHDSGKTWSRVPQIDEVPINELTFAENGTLLYVTTGDGVVLLSNP